MISAGDVRVLHSAFQSPNQSHPARTKVSLRDRTMAGDNAVRLKRSLNAHHGVSDCRSEELYLRIIRREGFSVFGEVE
jgi:hypothetical protein